MHIAAHGGKEWMSGIALAPNPTPSSMWLPKEKDYLLTVEDRRSVKSTSKATISRTELLSQWSRGD